MSRVLLGIALLASLVMLVGCSAPSRPAEAPPTAAPDASGGAAGTQLAVGLHERADGTVAAIGWIEEVDLEGGFWRVVDQPPTSSANSKTVAVIANGDDFEKQLRGLTMQRVQVVGKKLEGASIRMAGPEIEMTEVIPADDNAGPAE